MPSFGGVGKEVISFVLSGDASGLISEFKDVEKAADKSLGATESKIEKLSATLTKVGAVSMATGLSTALGLVQFVKDAEEAEEATNKFETAIKGMGSAIDTKAIKRLAFDLQQVSQVTDEQVVAAARWGAVYGLTTRQLEQLLTAAVDLSAQTGKSLDVVTKQLAKAAAGEGYKGLTKLGLTFDETAYKADAFGTTVSEASEFAAGAAAKQTDTMSGQLTRLGNNWDNVKEQIGAGANEVFEPLARGAAGLMETLAEANPELLKTVGHFTAIGSLGMTGFGAVATFAGQIVNIRDALDGLGVKLKNAEGGLTGFGKAAAAVGAIGLAAGIYQIADAMHEASKDAAALQSEFNSLSTGGNLKTMANDFFNVATGTKSLMDGINKFTSQALVNMPGSFRDTNGAMHETVIEMDDLRDGLEKIKGDPEALANALAVLRESQGQGKGTQKELNAEIDKYQKLLDSTKDKAEGTGAATDDLVVSEEDLKAAAKEVTEALKLQSPAMFLAAASAEQGAAGVKAFAAATEAWDSDELVTSAVDLGDAFHTVGETVKDLPKTFDENAAALGLYNEEQTKAIAAVTDWGDAAKAQIETLIASGKSTDEVNMKAKAYTGQLADVMRQAGFTEEQIQDYQRTLGLTDDQIATAVILAGDEEAKFRLNLLSSAIAGFNADDRNAILMRIAMGDYQGALYGTQVAMQRQANGMPVKIPVWAQFMGWHGQNPYGVGYSGGGGWGGKSAPAVAATSNVVPMTTAAPLANTPATININVTAGIGDPAEIGRKVIDSIRAAERVQGRGWRAA